MSARIILAPGSITGSRKEEEATAGLGELLQTWNSDKRGGIGGKAWDHPAGRAQERAFEERPEGRFILRVQSARNVGCQRVSKKMKLEPRRSSKCVNNSFSTRYEMNPQRAVWSDLGKGANNRRLFQKNDRKPVDPFQIQSNLQKPAGNAGCRRPRRSIATRCDRLFCPLATTIFTKSCWIAKRAERQGETVRQRRKD